MGHLEGHLNQHARPKCHHDKALQESHTATSTKEHCQVDPVDDEIDVELLFRNAFDDATFIHCRNHNRTLMSNWPASVLPLPPAHGPQVFPRSVTSRDRFRSDPVEALGVAPILRLDPPPWRPQHVN